LALPTELLAAVRLEERKKRARSPPSAFRGLPIFLSGALLMDAINQLAAVFHLRMYHCSRQPPSGGWQDLHRKVQNRSVLLW
jgi:hypothetical protein